MLYKNNAKILFRTSGGRVSNKELGFGHIFRCINLAKKLPKNELFFLIEDYGNVKPLLKKNKFRNVIHLKNHIDVESDIAQTSKIIKKYNIDLVIVDKYKTKKIFLKKINKITKVVYITDLKEIDYQVDLIVNGFIGFKNKICYNDHQTKLLLGPRYQILNEDFSKDSQTRKKYDLLVTFGGFDEKCIIDLFLERWEELSKKLKTIIILGPATKKSKKIKHMKKKYSDNLIFKDQTTKMSKEMEYAKYGLCSGGLTTYEFTKRNVPFAIICQEKHQLITAKEWAKRNIAKNLGIINKNTYVELDKFLNEIIQKKIKLNSNTNIIDGFGSKRVAREITKLINIR